MDHHLQQSGEVIQGIAPHSCQVCAVISFDPSQCVREGQCGQPFYFSRHEVFNAAFHGCHLFLWALGEALRIIPRLRQGGAELWELQILPTLDEGVGTLGFSLTGDPLEQVWSRHVFVTEGSPASSYIDARPLRPQVSLETAKSYLQRCRDGHAKCSLAESRFTGGMPTRLIYINPADSVTIYVKDAYKDPAVRIPYAALSYCWGDAALNRLKTTQDSLSAHQQGIDCSQLPKTIRDAVETTRALGLEYLWVDSLCIVQDDDEDKEREIAKMSQIYEGATVTISAARATHCDEGFLHERNLAKIYGDVYELPWRGGNEDDRGHRSVFCCNGDIRRCETEPIDSRAWTMQEHFLSKRLLRFGTSQLVWECREGVEVDGGSNDIDPPDEVSVGIGQVLKDWRQDVARYTARNISNPEDRLPAIAAIAETYEKRLKSTPRRYAAGLWEELLPFTLLWYIAPRTKQKTTCPGLPDGADVSPTWSWHLAPSGVKFADVLTSPHSRLDGLEIEECNVTLATALEYGRVVGGSLVVRGFLQEVYWTGNSFMRTSPGDSDSIASIRTFWDSQTEPVCGQTFCCLEVISEGCMYGLILKATDEETRFRRVGYFSSQPPKWIDLPDEVTKWLRQSDRRRITLI